MKKKHVEAIIGFVIAFPVVFGGSILLLGFNGKSFNIESLDYVIASVIGICAAIIIVLFVLFVDPKKISPEGKKFFEEENEKTEIAEQRKNFKKAMEEQEQNKTDL